MAASNSLQGEEALHEKMGIQSFHTMLSLRLVTFGDPFKDIIRGNEGPKTSASRRPTSHSCHTSGY